jgi:hypothetical protein
VLHIFATPSVRPLRIPAGLLLLAGVAALAALGVRWGYRTWTRAAAITLPAVPTLNLLDMYVDRVPVSITIRGAAAPWRTTASELRGSVELWRRMHLEDWNAVPEGLREDSLDRLLDHYYPILMSPDRWDRMDADSWDVIPQPIRTLAFRQMAAYWAGFYGVGDRYGLDPVVIRRTLAAIAMSESWFDHRAISISRDGNRDLGLAQASDYARERFRTLHERGVVDVRLEDDEYFDPWKATRFLALWFRFLLDEADGDLDLAIRAYHRGTAGAADRLATGYLEVVKRRQHRFIENRGAPPAWDYFWRRGMEIESREWPWLSSPGHSVRYR